MKILCIICFGLFFFQGYSQSRNVTGRLTDESGEPLPGVNIIIKGTTTGTVTDLDGSYSIYAPIGSTLVFSFIGLETREMIVTEEALKKAGGKKSGKPDQFIRPEFPFKLVEDSTEDKAGIGTFNRHSKKFKSYSTLRIQAIKKVIERKNQFVIKSLDDQTVKKGVGLQYSQVLGLSRVTQLPGLQSYFAQGRPEEGSLQWQGPETGELFSWGPQVSSLEFDGSSYPFDQNGRLTPVGTGNGTPAETYDNIDFFRTGFINKHNLLFTNAISGNGSLIAGISWENQSSIIPNAEKENFSANIDLRQIDMGRAERYLSELL